MHKCNRSLSRQLARKQKKVSVRSLLDQFKLTTDN